MAATVQPPEPESVPLAERYDPGAPVWYDTIADAAQAWLTFQWSAASRSRYEPGTLLASENLIFHQHPDGHGWVEHGESTCALRLPDGTVLQNATCETEAQTMHVHNRMSTGLRQAQYERALEVTCLEGEVAHERGWPDYACACGTIHDSLHEFHQHAERPEIDVDLLDVPFAFVEELVERETDHDPTDFMDGVVAATEHDVPPVWDGTERTVDDETTSPGVMVIHHTGVRVFVGNDPTAHRRNQMFGFVVGPEHDIADATEAIELLKPEPAREAIDAGETVQRQGEWWLLPTEPAAFDGSIQKPGVAERPFGSSPLENHIPRDWATFVDNETFLSRFREVVPDAYARPFDSPQDAVAFVHEHLEDPAVPITMHDVRTLADGVVVRGTLRHREQEHYVESLGEEWFRPVTHDWPVYTAEEQYQVIHCD